MIDAGRSTAVEDQCVRFQSSPQDDPRCVESGRAKEVTVRRPKDEGQSRSGRRSAHDRRRWARCGRQARVRWTKDEANGVQVDGTRMRDLAGRDSWQSKFESGDGWMLTALVEASGVVAVAEISGQPPFFFWGGSQDDGGGG